VPASSSVKRNPADSAAAKTSRGAIRCRFCGAALDHEIIDLGTTPLCENLRRQETPDAAETYYPLRLMRCRSCGLTQLSVSADPQEIFREYPYFSSVSSSWVAHAKQLVQSMDARLSLNGKVVIEVASNDGYLLKHAKVAGARVLGIEPALNVASVARSLGIETISKFLDAAVADEIVDQHGSASWLVANNVIAHVPDLNGFVSGLEKLLAQDGVLTIEIPHLMQLLANRQFDTIYHEHYCYFSLAALTRVLAQHGLEVFDVEELKSHGGSLRVYAAHTGQAAWDGSRNVAALLAREREFGLEDDWVYDQFAADVNDTRRKLLSFLLNLQEDGKTVAGYGAPGKATTLLHACGIDKHLLPWTVDRNTYKQGHAIPGTGIEIRKPDEILKEQPDFVLILAWNLAREITQQMKAVESWGGRFVIPIPQLTIL